jgi:hypothetical protein
MSQSLKVSFFDKFGAIGSQPIFDSFKQGLIKNGATIEHHSMNSDVAVIWSVLWRGQMLQNKAVWEIYRKSGRSVIVLESGTLSRGNLFRVGLNGINVGAYDYITQRHSNRNKKIGIDLLNWNNKDSYVLFCTQHSDSHQWSQCADICTYVTQTIETIRRFTDRKILLRPHPRNVINQNLIKKFKNVEYGISKNINGSEEFYEVLNNAFITVNYSSSPGIESIIRGVPSIVSPLSLAYPMTSSFELIESPNYPDREKWFEYICHTEWSIDELMTGDIQHQLLTTIGSST